MQTQYPSSTRIPGHAWSFRPTGGSCPSYHEANRPIRRAQRQTITRVKEASAQAAVPDTQESISVLRQAAGNWAVPSARVFRALWQLEKEGLPEDSWGKLLGEGKGGRRWRLVFTSGANDVKKGSKSGEGGGFYFPLDAVQTWENDKENFEGGVYFGQLGALTFIGPFQYAKKKMSFDFTKMRLRLGPKWFPFNFKSSRKGGQLPFYLFFYVDNDIACARGRGGGYAMWQRTTAEWDVKAGITL